VEASATTMNSSLMNNPTTTRGKPFWVN